jgi:hypothetical protein
LLQLKIIKLIVFDQILGWGSVGDGMDLRNSVMLMLLCGGYGVAHAFDVHFEVENRTGLSENAFLAKMRNQVKYVVWKGCASDGKEGKSFLTPTVTVPFCFGEPSCGPSMLAVEIGNWRSRFVPIKQAKEYLVELWRDPQREFKIVVH